MGGVVSGVTEALGLTADQEAGSGAAGYAGNLEARAVAELEKLDIPDIEKQKILLELPKLVGLMQAEELDQSALESIDLDPELRENIMSAIESEKEYADTGITDEDRARLESLRREAQADESARQESILQSMAERGALGSGSELAARLQSNQATADRAQQQARELAAQASQNRRQAAQNVANMSGQLDAQDFARQAQRASAADEIARFNAMNRQNIAGQNLAQRQSIADQGTALRNQQQMYNKGLIQEQFNNQLRKATGMTNQIQNQAQGFRDQAAMQAQAAQQQAAGNRALVGSGMQAYAMSDEKTKENVSPARTEDLDNLFENLEAKSFDYKDEFGGGEGYTGVMAQDLEKSNIGNDMVEESPEGIKMVDKDKALMSAIAQLSELTKRVKDMEAPKNESEAFDMDRRSGKGFNDGGFGASKDDMDDTNFDPDKDKTKQILSTLAKGLSSSEKSIPVRRNSAKKIYGDPLAGMRYNEGGAPSSYTEGGERIDELVDMGELSVNEPAQEDLMEYLRGTKEVEDMDQGRIVEGDSYSGDLLPDRINSGEMVLNLGQQDRMKEELMDQESEARGFRKLLKMLGEKK